MSTAANGGSVHERVRSGVVLRPWPALLAAAAAWAAPSWAQSVRLNDPLAQPGAGDVTEYEIDPAGTHVVYRADQVQDGVFELFAAPLDHSTGPVRLHAPLTGPNKDVTSFAIGAGGRVVYIADLVTDERFELYGAPLEGSASPALLSGAMVAGGDVTSFQLTPDGTRAVFFADWLVNDRPELFVVPVDGSAAPLRLDPGDRTASGLYRISQDGAFVVYATTTSTIQRLYRTPLDASQAPLFLADSGPTTLERTYFEDLALAADDEHGAFVRIEEFLDRGNVQRAGVFGLALDGSGSAQLHLEDANLFFDPFPSYAVSGSRVVYTEPSGECYTIEGDGSGRVLLGTDVSVFALSPNGARVAFLSGTPAASTLFQAPVDGSSPPTAMTAPGQLERPRFSPNSLLVLFIATNPATSFRGLYAVTIAPGPPLLFNAPPAPDRGVLDFAVAPDGQTVVYSEDRAFDEVYELWSVDVDLVPRKLSGPLGGFRDVLSFRVSPDSQRVAYLADQNLDQTDELFGAPIDAATPAVQYNDPLPGGPVLGDVLDFQATSSGTHVVYRADQESDGFYDLFSTRADGRGDPVRLTVPLTDDRFVSEFTLTPSGSKVVFAFTRIVPPSPFPETLCVAPRSGAGPALELDFSPDGFTLPLVDASESFAVYRRIAPSGFQSLHRVDLDGGSPPVTLADIPLLNQSVGQFQITGDGLGVVYLANLENTAETELFRVPSDGSGPAIQLSAPMTPGGDVFSFQLSLDSARVVYRAHQDVFGRFELYGAPSDGSGPVVKLNGVPVANGDVEEYALTPDGTRVVYRADQVVNDQHELFAAPLAGGTPAVRLTVLSAGRHVEPDFALGADSSAVFYRADALTLSVLELFTVPTDASASPLRLSASLVGGGNVDAFAVSPDQAWVVYRADQDVDQLFELFSVPATGGSAVALNPPLPATADVTDFRISPDSQWVFFLADAFGVDRFELFRAPLDGSAPPERINRNLPTGGDVQSDFVPLPGGRVLYRAEQESNDVFELYDFLNLDGHALPAGPPTETGNRPG